MANLGVLGNLLIAFNLLSTWSGHLGLHRVNNEENGDLLDVVTGYEIWNVGKSCMEKVSFRLLFYLIIPLSCY